MKGIKVYVILLILLSIGAFAIAVPATSVTPNEIGDTGVSNSAIIFDNGKPVQQVVGPIGSSSVQPFDNSTYKYLDAIGYPQTFSYALVNWTITNEHINMTFAEYQNGVFVKYDSYSMNVTVAGQ